MASENVRPVRVGLIGCGRIAQIIHLKALAGLRSAKVVALADTDPGNLEDASAPLPEAKTFHTHTDLLRESDVDAVVICVPPAAHRACAIAAFEAGKHVYLEKPITVNVREAGDVLRAWRSAGTVGMIGFNFRFHPLYVETRNLISSGSIGELVAARSVFTVSPRWLPPWKRKRETGGGVLLDLGSHHIDLARYLFDQEIVEVSAFERSQRVEQDNALLSMRLESGALIQSLVSMGAIDEHRWEIYGQTGKLSLDKYTSVEVDLMRPLAPFDPIRKVWNAFRDLRPGKLFRPTDESSFAIALEAFVRSIRDGSRISPDLNDAYRSLAIVEAAERSAATGTAVRLDPAPLEEKDDSVRLHR